LAKHGLNKLVEKKRTSIVLGFLAQMKDLFGILLLFASLLAAVGGMIELSAMILVVVVVNATLSLVQEWRAEKAMETLKRWMPEYCKVFRDGELKKIHVEELVPGDIIALEEGDRVPADARVIEAFDLWTNNVPLTGESEPQPRSARPTTIVDTAFLDAPSLVFMSTSVAKGQGKAVVVETGMNTKFGQIADLTQQISEEPSPLQKEIANTARYDFILAITVGFLFFLASIVWLHLDFYSSILFMIGVMVACVPEGLQVTVSSALAINMLKMVKENVLVKRLSAVQTLGNVTVICTDKTGTITKGEMTVSKFWLPDRVIDISGVGYTPIGEFTSEGKTLGRNESRGVELLLEAIALCNSAKIEPPNDRSELWTVVGDPTDGALLVAALKHGLNIQISQLKKPTIHVIPFDSKRKRMTTIHRSDQGLVAYTKGAPRSILSLCDKIFVDGVMQPLQKENLSLIEKRIRRFADKGLRVIAVAFKNMPTDTVLKSREVEKNMVFVGIAGMKDPLRPEVEDAVRVAKQAGIRVVIITGDYGPTAQAIAEEAGIVDPTKCQTIRGVDLETMEDSGIADYVKKGDVIFARVSPEQKLRIVKALKERGEVVAVTGDGANDAPSLKEADIGIAMGTSGTDVAREAADMVLLDDSFASIVKAVESGRTIYENLRKFIVYVFTHNWAQLLPFMLYALLGIPLPLLVVQILAIDLGIEVVPSLALSREPPESGMMLEPPRSVKERLFNKKVFLKSLYMGLIIGVGALYGCLTTWSKAGWYLGSPTPPASEVYAKGTTMTFAGIVTGQVGNVLACRTNKQSVFKTGIKSNKWIWVGIATQISTMSLLIYVPIFQGFFGTTSIGLQDWLHLIALACIVVLVEEFRKLLSRKLANK
jgi:calcium-translocating P-type ATPase